MSSQTLIEKFIYSCSHDLRSPVASIQGLVRIAEYSAHSPEIHQCLEMIEACTYEMDKRISKLQEYMVNNMRPLSMEQIDPHELFEKIKNEFRNQLDTFEIEMSVDVQQPDSLSVDLQGTYMLLKYLISNSIAFHDPDKRGRKIVIRFGSNGTGSTIEVSDNGKGIPEEQQSRIFDVFFRGTEQSIGQGMGLFLAKSLTEKMGGTISCTSVLQEGTSMRISFPPSGNL